mmetsp:Transcript_43438/g.87823  ORF Transcript_43438/g.87823 Transcript_43438/m.87823 type:complete len:388 (-) Transcript_43438:150-1313(-)
MNTNTYSGHAFRVRTTAGVLLMEYKAPPKGSSYGMDSTDAMAKISPCGNLRADVPLWGEGREQEFEALAQSHSNPCLPANRSKLWSCVKYYSREDVRSRNASLYGFQPGETGTHRLHNTFDKSYTSQISKIPKLTPRGPGFLKMGMTEKLKALLLEWYQLRKTDSLVDHGVIAGGYTNNDKVAFDKIDLDRFRQIHGGIVKEMQEVLQWWTDMRLRHTSTFGVRVYRRHSMLIDHVDRMDTHLASAVLQVAQEVDDDGGWPLEVLLPSGRAGEVYLQPGEMVLYEGAWLRHGRPMRLKGDEFANIFSHFAPLDWRGPSDADSPTYNGFVKGRCDTIADEHGASSCREPEHGKYKENEVGLDFGRGVELPPLGPNDGGAEGAATTDEL